MTDQTDAQARSTRPRRARRSADGGDQAPQLDSREAILTAALEAFSREGFEGASLPSIARAANVGHPLIHYHFKSKDNLWRRTVEYAFGDLIHEVETIERAAQDVSPIDRLRILIRALTIFSARHPGHLSLIMLEGRSNSERYVWLQKNYTQVFFRQLSKVLLDAQSAGQIKAGPVDHLCYIVMGAVLLYFTGAAAPTGEIEDIADRHASLVLDTVLSGIAVEA